MKILENIEINYSNEKIDYLDSINFMEKRVSEINANKREELIWFLNHDHLYTMGTSGSKNEIRSEINIPLIKTNRGGKITYHGPGQRIIYFLIDLKKRKKDIRMFVSSIENAVILLLKEFNLEASTFNDRIGIWVTKNKNTLLPKEQKIGAIGLRLKKWTTYHGLSFNINPDLKYFDKIDACGLTGYQSTSMKELGKKINTKEFDKLFLSYFLKELKRLK